MQTMKLGEEMVIEAPGLRITIKAGDYEYSTAVFVTAEDGHVIQHFDCDPDPDSAKPYLRIDASPDL